MIALSLLHLNLPLTGAELGVSDFASTGATSGSYSALVAFASQGKPSLCELDGSANFQPELKAAEDLWFASNGSGMLITDPILALFRNVFWHDAAPDVTGGVFTAYWALHHACEVNPGGINHPIRIATLRVTDQKVVAAMYTDDQLQETSDLVSAAIDHVRGFKDVLLGNLKVGSAPPSLK